MVTSLQDLSHNHIYQYTQMVNAPAGGSQAQPGVATGHNVLAWRLGYAEVFYTLYRSRSCGIFT
ncbi:hypothetical protein N9R66_00055 [bacterium]|nr:hypothetical protein [bacterium]